MYDEYEFDEMAAFENGKEHGKECLADEIKEILDDPNAVHDEMIEAISKIVNAYA